MILTCPSCGTQYVVKDGAIPDGGRQVRCASCKHSWHQDPEPENAEELTLTSDEELPPEQPQSFDPGETSPEPENPGFEVEDTPEQPAYVAPIAEEPGSSDSVPYPPVVEDDEFEPFGQRRDEDEDATPSRTWPKLLLLVLFVAVAAAAFWFLAPQAWKSRIGVADAGATELKLMLTNSQRQQLASGNMLLAVTGRVINPTGETQRVPPIEAELRKTSGEIVYRWTIAPPASSLPPGGRAPFNSAEVNVPADGDLLTIAFGAAA